MGGRCGRLDWVPALVAGCGLGDDRDQPDSGAHVDCLAGMADLPTHGFELHSDMSLLSLSGKSTSHASTRREPAKMARIFVTHYVFQFGLLTQDSF